MPTVGKDQKLSGDRAGDLTIKEIHIYYVRISSGPNIRLTAEDQKPAETRSHPPAVLDVSRRRPTSSQRQ